MIAPLLAMAFQSGFVPARLAAIPVQMRQYTDQGQISGIVTMVTRHGKTVLLDAQGYARVETRQPMRTDTIFQIMSMTKPVTAIAVVMCAEAGLLNLDDRVEKYLPAFRDVVVKGSGVAPRVRPTIRHLLTHTAGLTSDDPAGLNDDQKRGLTLAEYGALLGKEPLGWEPGTEIHYSGPGFAALGRIVEIVSRMPFEVFCQKRIFDPLGMRDTFFFLPPELRDRLAFTYAMNPTGLATYDNGFREGAKFANPAGGLYLTAADMATLLGCVVDGGAKGKYRLLSPAGIATMTALQTGDLRMDGNDAQGFGLGFAVVRGAAGQSTLKPVGSFGHTGAYGTEFWTDRERGFVSVFMVQGFDYVADARRTFNTMVNAAFVGP